MDSHVSCLTPQKAWNFPSICLCWWGLVIVKGTSLQFLYSHKALSPHDIVKYTAQWVQTMQYINHLSGLHLSSLKLQHYRLDNKDNSYKQQTVSPKNGSSVTHPHVVPNLYDVPSSVEHKKYFEKCFSVCFCFLFFSPKIIGYQHFSKYLIFSVLQKE